MVIICPAIKEEINEYIHVNSDYSASLLLIRARVYFQKSIFFRRETEGRMDV
jgi:hypothetical protein